MLRPALLLFLSACAPPVIDQLPDRGQPSADDSAASTVTDDETAAPTDTSVDTGAGGDTDPAPDTGAEDTDAPPEVSEETIGDHVLDDSWFFSHDTIHTIDITLPSSSWGALFADPYTYAQAGVTVDGEAVTDVGVRLRGKIGSFRDLNGKPKFKIDFNQYVEGQRFYGLETLSLNNEVADCSYLKEPIGYALFEEMGVPAPRTGFAAVTVNGAPYGLYVIIETPDDRFLDRAYEEPGGNLYDGKYIWYGDYSYTLLDFGDGVDDLYQLEEGTDVGNADIAAISDALFAARAGGNFYEDMGAVLDWDNFHRVWAGEQWLGQNDGYVLNTNNYRVYFDPTDGLAKLVPWDLDNTFLYDWEWGMDWWGPRGNLAVACLEDDDCVAAQRIAMAETIAAAESADLLTLHAQLRVLIAEEAAADPRRECADSSVSSEQTEVQSWLNNRSDELRREWGL